MDVSGAKTARVFIQGQCSGTSCSGATLDITVVVGGVAGDNFILDSIQVPASEGFFSISKSYDVPGTSLSINAGTGLSTAVFTGIAGVFARAS